MYLRRQMCRTKCLWPDSSTRCVLSTDFGFMLKNQQHVIIRRRPLHCAVSLNHSSPSIHKVSVYLSRKGDSVLNSRALFTDQLRGLLCKCSEVPEIICYWFFLELHLYHILDPAWRFNQSLSRESQTDDIAIQTASNTMTLIAAILLYFLKEIDRVRVFKVNSLFLLPPRGQKRSVRAGLLNPLWTRWTMLDGVQV